MEDETMEFDLTKGEIELLKDHYKDKIFQTIRDFDKILNYQKVKDVENLIYRLNCLIEDYNKYNFK